MGSFFRGISIHIMKKWVNSQIQNIYYQSRRRGLVGMRGKQSVRKGVWYIGGRTRLRKRTKREQRGKGLPIGLLVSAAAPFLGEVAKPLLKKFFVGE